MSKISETANMCKILHPSTTTNSQVYIDDVADQGIINLQYAINKRAVIDLSEKLNTESVKHLCNYLLTHIIEDEHSMKEVIYKALEMRQMKSLKQLEKTIKESEDIITDMKMSLDEMYKLMCEGDEVKPVKKAPVASPEADEIEKKLKESTNINENENENENDEDESEENNNED